MDQRTGIMCMIAATLLAGSYRTRDELSEDGAVARAAELLKAVEAHEAPRLEAEAQAEKAAQAHRKHHLGGAVR